MKIENSKLNCQIPCLKNIGEGFADPPALHPIKRIKLVVRRFLSPSLERTLKNRLGRLTGMGSRPSKPLLKGSQGKLQAGDMVRVRSLKEIEAALDHWGQVKGCGFMSEMEKYCGTKQKVLKRMRRYIMTQPSLWEWTILRHNFFRKIIL